MISKATNPGSGTIAVDEGGRQDVRRQRRQRNHRHMLDAAMALFRQRGYLAVSVEEIAGLAGVSRMTFYRHFSGKADLAAALFERSAQVAMPRYLAIRTMPFHQRDAVIAWLTMLFEADTSDRVLLRIYTQATAEDGFTERARDLIGQLVRGLGSAIPAFALDPARPEHYRRWIEAWFLLYEILDHSNHAALDLGVATTPLVIEILADRFLFFVERGAPDRPVSGQSPAVPS